MLKHKIEVPILPIYVSLPEGNLQQWDSGIIGKFTNDRVPRFPPQFAGPVLSAGSCSPVLFLVSSPYTLVNLVKTNFYMSWGSHIEIKMNQNKHVVELMRFCGIGLSTNALEIGQKNASNSNSRNFGWVLYVLLVQLKGWYVLRNFSTIQSIQDWPCGRLVPSEVTWIVTFNSDHPTNYPLVN